MHYTFLNFLRKKGFRISRACCCVLLFLFIILISTNSYAQLPLCSNESETFAAGLVPDVGHSCEGDLQTCKSLKKSGIDGVGPLGEAIYRYDSVIEGLNCTIDLPNCETIDAKAEPGINCQGYLPYCNDIKDTVGNYKYALITESLNCNTLPYCHDLDSIKRNVACPILDSADYKGEFDKVRCLYDKSLEFVSLCDEFYPDNTDEASDARSLCRSSYASPEIEINPEGDDQNCILKSCAHLSNSDFYYINGYEKIDKLFPDKTNLTTEDQDQIIQILTDSAQYKYCSPYIYKIIDNKFTEIEQKLRCHMINYDDLDYINKSGSEKTQCFKHRCELRSYESLSCGYDIYKSGESYNLKWRNDSYKNIYEEKILGKTDESQDITVDKSCLFEPDSCSITRYTTDKMCEGVDLLNTECDVCVGVDKNAPDSSNCEKYNTVKQTCDQEHRSCTKTVDCGYSETEYCNGTSSIPQPTDDVTSNFVDNYKSWFYRPFPIKEAFKGVGRSTQDYNIFRNDPNITNEDNSITEGRICYTDSQYFNTYGGCTPYFCISYIFGSKCWGITGARCSNAGCIVSNIGEVVGRIIGISLLNIGSYGGCLTEYNLANPELNSPPTCIEEHSGGSTRSPGRTGICKSEALWQKPDMNKSAFISGDMVVDYTDENGNPVISPNDATYKIKVGVRYHNALELKACGRRECRTDCIGNACNLQYCGYDQHAILKTNQSMACDVINNTSAPCIAYPATSWGPLDKEVRVRSQVFGNKVCVFLDMISTAAQAYDLYTKPRSIAGGGYLDKFSLLDDNTRDEFENCPEGVVRCSLKLDKDIFGENIISKYDCPTNLTDFMDNMGKTQGAGIIERSIAVNPDLNVNELKEKLQKCRELAINVNMDGGPWKFGEPFTDKWFAIDVVQYIGNNQPEGSPRGYYDADGNFFPEQQCMKIPLAIGPPKFYKYATMENTPKLFLPILSIDGVIRQCLAKKEDTNECESADIGDIQNTYATFIDPGVSIKYGNNTQLSYVPFGLVKYPSGTSMDEYKEIEAKDEKNNKTYYFLEKIYEYGQAKLCLKQLGFTEGKAINARIGCVSRNKPGTGNLIIMPGDGTDYNQGSIKAMFVENKVENAPCSTFGGVNRCIKIEEPNQVNNARYVALKSKSSSEKSQDNIEIGDTGVGDGYAIAVNYSNDTCSKLSNECITNRINLFIEKAKINPDIVKLEFYQDFENKCKFDIARRCDFLKSKDNAYGHYHEACIVEGYEHALRRVISYNYGSDGPMGKCIISDASKMNPECRIDIYENGNNICACSGEDCQALPSKCYSGGRNGYGTSYMNIEGLGENEYVQAPICKCVGIGDELPNNVSVNLSTGNGYYKNPQGGTEELILRMETPREAGFCVDIPLKTSCEGNSYGINNNPNSPDFLDEEGKPRGLYWQNDAGKKVSEIHPSHIERTKQIGYEESGHAEFPTVVEDMIDVLLGGVPGDCNGFWKQAENLPKEESIPTAICTLKEGNLYGEGEFTNFKNSCVRYNCSEIKSKAKDDDKVYKEGYLPTYEYEGDDEIKGKSHGFAEWPEFDRNAMETYSEDKNGDGTFDADKNNDEYPDIDDIIIVKAGKCIDGYGPNGANDRIHEFLQLVGKGEEFDGRKFDSDNSVLKNQNILYKSGISAGKANYLSSTLDQNPAIEVLLGYNKEANDSLTGGAFGSEPKNLADARLPKRYCNQMGEWEIVLDKNNVPQFETYDVGNDKFNINYKCLGDNEESTDCNKVFDDVNGGYIDATQRYCERLYCPEKIISDIENDMNEDAKREFWNRTGGATWEKTLASRFKDELVGPVYGTCDMGRNYYPRDTHFIEEIIGQDSEFAKNPSSLFIKEDTTQTHPIRYCNNMGVWSPITLPCVKSCPYIGRGLKNADGTAGDTSTGGARWKKVLSTQDASKAGEILNKYKELKCTKNSDGAINECFDFNWEIEDGVIGKVAYMVQGHCDPLNENPKEGFIQDPNGRPMRECQADGTWGSIINRCWLARPCPTIGVDEALKISGATAVNGYATWDAGDSFDISSISANGAILDIAGTCLRGFWVNSDASIKPTRKCDSRVTVGQETGSWESIPSSQQCKVMTCGNIIYDGSLNTIYETQNLTVGVKSFYVKDIIDQYPSANMSSFTGHTIINNDENTCETGDATCLKNLVNYASSTNITPNQIVKRKICRIGYESKDLQVTCKINPDNNQPEWFKTAGSSCQINKCNMIENPTEESGYATWPQIQSSRDANGDGQVVDTSAEVHDEIMIAKGLCKPGYGGAPTRECLSNGTWGEIQNPCIPSCSATDSIFINSGIDAESIEWQVNSDGGKELKADSETITGECRDGYGPALISSATPIITTSMNQETENEIIFITFGWTAEVIKKSAPQVISILLATSAPNYTLTSVNQIRSNTIPTARCSPEGKWIIENSCSPIRSCNTNGILMQNRNVNAGDCGNGLFYYINFVNFIMKHNGIFELTISDFCAEGGDECDMRYFYWKCKDGTWEKIIDGQKRDTWENQCYLINRGENKPNTYTQMNGFKYFGDLPISGYINIEIYDESLKKSPFGATPYTVP